MIDNPSLLENLRREVTAMPPGALLPRDWLLERLSENAAYAPTSGGRPAPPVDLTVGYLAKLFGRQPSTVRAWLERGDFPGGYKLHGKEWRVPASGLEAFQNRQRTGARLERAVGGAARLSDWRKAK